MKRKRPWFKREPEPETVEGSGVFGSSSKARETFNSRRFSPTTDKPLSKEEFPEGDELGPPGSLTIQHSPRTHDEFSRFNKCNHSAGFKVDSVNLKSQMLDERCLSCGFGRIRGMTPDEIETYSHKQK